LSAFQDERSKARVLVSHPKLMAHGVTLTAADTIVWFGPHASAETVQQAEARITRFGQEREQFIYHLRSSHTEDNVYKTLKERGSMQDTILGMFEAGFVD
jgi:SNF2 family DNA or RNA helicase